MNEIKKSLIEAAGEMHDSKERVRSKVHEHQEKKQNTKRNRLFGITVVAIIPLFFIVTALFLINEPNDTQAIDFDEQIFDTTMKIQKAMGFYNDMDEEYIMREVYESYETNLAYYTFAQSLGYEITDEEIEQQYEETLQFMYQSEESKKSHLDLLNSANVSLKEYENLVFKNSPYRVAQRKLEAHFKELYPKIDSLMASAIAKKHAVPYFRENYASEIKELEKKYNLSLVDNSLSIGGKILGRVVALEDNMFLVVPKATIEDIQTLTGTDIVKKYNEGYWVPQDDTPKLHVGDLVEVFHSFTATSTVPYVTDIQDMNMIDTYEPEQERTDTITITIPDGNFGKVKGFVAMLSWEKADFEMSRPADYDFVVNNTTYQIWAESDGFVLISSYGEYRKLNDEFTNELSGYLELK